jgi:hypothetical protein
MHEVEYGIAEAHQMYNSTEDALLAEIGLADLILPHSRRLWAEHTRSLRSARARAFGAHVALSVTKRLKKQVFMK